MREEVREKERRRDGLRCNDLSYTVLSCAVANIYMYIFIYLYAVRSL